ncbi:DNA polymerase III subunit delta' [Mesorhizobium liriopis]
MVERLAPEQHDTLDNIPEPAENPNLFGHHETITRLLSMQTSGRLPHGLILSGPTGIGKATLAFHFARHLLSRQSGSDLATVPIDGAIFRQVASGAHPAVLHLTRPLSETGKGFKTVLSVKEIRRIGRFLSHTSHDGGYRMVIVDSVDDMNTEAANALLKNLEEPPSRTVFILIAHARRPILPTLRSRCQVLKLDTLEADDLSAALQSAGAPLPDDPSPRQAIIEGANGSVRQAILLMRHGGVEIAGALDAAIRNARLDTLAANRLADQVAAKGKETAFTLLHDRALEMLTEGASEAALRGELGRAERLSSSSESLRDASREAMAYNLDRKQQALDLINAVHRAVHGG